MAINSQELWSCIVIFHSFFHMLLAKYTLPPLQSRDSMILKIKQLKQHNQNIVHLYLVDNITLAVSYIKRLNLLSMFIQLSPCYKENSLN